MDESRFAVFSIQAGERQLSRRSEGLPDPRVRARGPAVRRPPPLGCRPGRDGSPGRPLARSPAADKGAVPFEPSCRPCSAPTTSARCGVSRARATPSRSSPRWRGCGTSGGSWRPTRSATTIPPSCGFTSASSLVAGTSPRHEKQLSGYTPLSVVQQTGTTSDHGAT